MPLEVDPAACAFPDVFIVYGIRVFGGDFDTPVAKGSGADSGPVGFE